MNLSASDYALAVVSSRLAPFLRHFGEVESDLLRARLDDLAIEKPLFVAGLARSGTTILLNLLAQCKGVATHRYRDFPFLWFPVTWNWFQDRLSHEETAVERPHRDRIRITKESPEAFEEPIWQRFFPRVHDPQQCHILDAETKSPEFEAYFKDHIRKILLVRRGDRYVSKGNYNIARLRFLARVFPDATFLVPIREPLAHVHSLVKQHRLFAAYAKEDSRVPVYLRAAGHYEFGPQRQPINLSQGGTQDILEAWGAGEDYRGYAMLWTEVYSHVRHLLSTDSTLAKRVLVIRFEDFCANPAKSLERVLEFAQLTEPGAHLLHQLDTVSAPPNETGQLPKELRGTVSAATENLAAHFGYAD